MEELERKVARKSIHARRVISETFSSPISAKTFRILIRPLEEKTSSMIVITNHLDAIMHVTFNSYSVLLRRNYLR